MEASGDHDHRAGVHVVQRRGLSPGLPPQAPRRLHVPLPARLIERRGALAGLLLTGAFTLAVASAWRVSGAAPPATHDWPAYGGGPEGIRYSPLARITRANV